MSQGFETVIGLEVHVQLKTLSKIFCDSATTFGQPPNTLVCPVCLGMPGVLPVLNRQAVEFGLRMALALNCKVAPESIFARKNYFYPDLPKGYQISQYDKPLAENGFIDLLLPDGERKRVGITRIHLEDDAGKSIHSGDSTDSQSLVDFNRTGMPLLEIVSEPDIRSPEEAAAYMRHIRQIVRYLEISDGNMQEGSLRCDANVSIRPEGQMEFGTRAELKNMNSFKFVAHALEYEVARQIEKIEEGGSVVQETRLWDENAGISRSMRSKEEAHDYRYFPDPDLLPIKIDDQWLNSVKGQMPELPLARLDRFIQTYGLSTNDAAVLTESKELADYFEAVLVHYDDAKKVCNWILAELLRELNKSDNDELENIPIAPENFARLLSLIDESIISGKIAKNVFWEMYQTGKSPDEIVEQKGLVQVSDRSEIESICKKIIEDNPSQVEQFRSGRDKIFGFFIGQAMKVTKGQANPKIVNQVFMELLK